MNLSQLKSNVDSDVATKKVELEKVWRSDAAFAGLDNMTSSSSSSRQQAAIPKKTVEVESWGDFEFRR